MRGGVGGGGQRGLYLGENTVDISKHIVVPEPQHAITACFDLACAARISSTLLVVLTAIEFDHQSRFAADEVDDEGADQGLPAKMRSRERDVFPQSSPKDALGLCRLRAHLLGELSLTFVHRTDFITGI